MYIFNKNILFYIHLHSYLLFTCNSFRLRSPEVIRVLTYRLGGGGVDSTLKEVSTYPGNLKLEWVA